MKNYCPRCRVTWKALWPGAGKALGICPMPRPRGHGMTLDRSGWRCGAKLVER